MEIQLVSTCHCVFSAALCSSVLADEEELWKWIKGTCSDYFILFQVMLLYHVNSWFRLILFSDLLLPEIKKKSEKMRQGRELYCIYLLSFMC